MTTASTAPPALHQRSLPDRVGSVEDRLTALERTFDETTEALMTRLGELEEELASVRRLAGGTTPTSEVDERITTFLGSMPGIKFSAVSVAENLGMEMGHCSDRLTALAGRGVLVRQQEPNRKPLYYSPVK